MKRIAVLGSTGSIGTNALEVIKGLPDDFRVVALSAHSNIGLLRRQIELFKPKMICVTDMNALKELKPKINRRIRVFCGEEGLVELCSLDSIDKIVLAISGSKALAPLLAAVNKGKEIALANKEALVMAGGIIMHRALRKNARIIPIDSEQSAIWQCLQGEDRRKLRRIYLTASGGPFACLDKRKLRKISIREVLRHPRWKMGKKITVDSATLMNKGLELLEAMALFNVAADKIKVLIHPEAIIHSMVEFVDGVVMAQLSVTDMRIPIQYALSYPQRMKNSLKSINFAGLRELRFEDPDYDKFPCLGLAYRAAREGGSMPCVMNAANEVSVREFLKGRIPFISIPRVIERVMEKHRVVKTPPLEEIYRMDNWARFEAQDVIGRMAG